MTDSMDPKELARLISDRTYQVGNRDRYAFRLMRFIRDRIATQTFRAYLAIGQTQALEQILLDAKANALTSTVKRDSGPRPCDYVHFEPQEEGSFAAIAGCPKAAAFRIRPAVLESHSTEGSDACADHLQHFCTFDGASGSFLIVDLKAPEPCEWLRKSFAPATHDVWDNDDEPF